MKGDTAVCPVCPHGCRLKPGETGRCRGRRNQNGQIVCGNYGQLTSLALDPIEKKPFARFYPGSRILSAGSYGCNMNCGFCQNHAISFAGEEDTDTVLVSPERLVETALRSREQGNIGIAFTYNEPFIGFEYMLDCARLAKQEGLFAAAVTNGYVNEEILRQALPFLDALNIDLKGFTPSWYQRLGGDLETVKRTISLSVKACHVEVTALIIPGENDSQEEMEELSSWLSQLDPDIPLHISRFFPRFQYAGRKPTPPETVEALCRTAGKRLAFVYPGNI